jgi:phenylpropionate dioxygenase-like ring-hydroxylating dioxygenase large terminal subunit
MRTAFAAGGNVRAMETEVEGGSSSGGLVQLRKGRASVVNLPDQWFILCLSSELRKKPIVRELFGTKLVLFRDGAGKVGALLDRCPHRNVPLSEGAVHKDGTLQCPYHGWRFDAGGACRFIPSLPGEPDGKARRALAFPTREQDGFVWVYSTPAEKGEPTSAPHVFAYKDKPGYSTVTQVVEAKGTLYSTIENALDVPHTAFLHRGLFRAESRGISITAKVHRTKDRVEAEYVGEPRPPGAIARILSPSGGIVTHFDRFILPSVAQVEYRIGTENHILVDSVMTPVSDYVTRIYAVVTFRARVPHWAIQPFIKPLALKVFQQDAVILEKQTETIHRFGGEQFVSTEIDVLGRHIWRLLRAAERGEKHGAEETDEVSLVV